MPPKRVFISYSHDAVEHEGLVGGLAASLRQDGIDCWIDQYLPAGPPEGWPLWMEKILEWADFVLMVCTESYYRRVRKETPAGEGQGVCWEAHLIYQHIYDSHSTNAKFIPVLFREEDKDFIPTPVKGIARHLLNTQDGYDLLYRTLTGQCQPLPALGKPKTLEIRETKPLFGPYGEGARELPARVQLYLDRLSRDTGRLELLGMGRSLQIDLPITDAYVPLRTTMARSFETRKTDLFREGLAEHEESAELVDVFQKAKILGERGVILLGEPGSGKTTGARQLAFRLASQESGPEDLGLPREMIPVFLRFRNLSLAALETNNGLRVLLEEETHCDEAPHGLESPGPDLWDGRAGPLLWILDGLDEVIDAESRRKVSGWLRKLLRGRPMDRFLVTCRFQGYFAEGVPLGPRFVEFHVRPLDDGQVERFVRAWFAAAYRRMLGPGTVAGARSSADSGELLEILARPAYQAGRIRELCTNPLLLTILCIVFHEERRLPTGRAELYAHCVKVFLEYWRRDLYTSELGTKIKPFDAEAAQTVLARLAWWMHQEQDRTTAGLDELAGEAEPALAEVAPDAGLGRAGRAFLERMRNEAGILALGGEGQGRCGFLHLSFQEYLVSDHATRNNLAKELASRVAESWWQEVGLLSLRHSPVFCEAFFRQMLRAGVAEKHPDLARRCLEEARFPVVKPFLEVLEKSVPTERVTAILRLFRDRVELVPGLREVAKGLKKLKNPEVRAAAEEVLLRLGAEPTRRDYAVSIDEKTGVAFVSIPPGQFQMGSDKGFPDERPVHPVKITKGYLLGKYPVTNAQYRRFLEAGGAEMERPMLWGDRRFNQAEQPVVGVSWDEARTYCKWAGGRLPTEAEWEYACRAGTETEYSFGDDDKPLGEHGWFQENSFGQVQPVGTKKANPWGLHDMHGNVWEWCQDWFSGEYYYEHIAGSDPEGPTVGVGRVVRGGAWYDPPQYCRSAYRYGSAPSARGDYLGFRVARSSAGEAGG